MVTFPGSYHSGFSTGLNIGEAVNFVTKTWIDYGFKCQNIYRESRERIPIFPIEWVCVENIKNLGSLNLSKDEILKIKQAYERILVEELKSRKTMEEKIKQHCR